MEPISILASSFLFLGAKLARKPADEFVDHVWKRIKETLWDSSAGPLTPDAITDAAIEHVIQRAPQVRRELEEVFGHYSALRRARMVGKAIRGARILWIDDRPENNIWERRFLENLGVVCVNVVTTRSAVAHLAAESFDIIISDIAREDRSRAGIEALPAIRAVEPSKPLLFYVGQVSLAGTPRDAQGIADDPNELLHLVLDQLERYRV